MSEKLEPDQYDTPAEGDVALRLYVLGGFGVSVGSRVVEETDWSLRKAKSLVKLLALAPRQRMHREQIMDLLWPELDPEAAANNLHKALHVARRVLEPELPPKKSSSYLHLQGEFVRLDGPRPLTIDVEAFRTAAAAAQMNGTPESYEGALRLYTGELLPEDRYEDWVVEYREELKALWLSLLVDLARLREQRGEAKKAIEAVRRVVSTDPGNEEANEWLMRLLVETGHRQQALRQYELLRDALHQELEIEPAPRIQALREQIINGNLSPDWHAISSPASEETRAARRGSDALPPLHGRDEELRELYRRVDALATGKGGVVFIKGEPGIGKTRLIVEVTVRASQSALTVVQGRLNRQRDLVSYDHFVGLLENFASQMAPASMDAILGDVFSELVGAMPALASALGVPNRSADSFTNPANVFSALSAFFQRLTARGPVVVILDDLHAADESSVKLLRSLARRTLDSSLLIIGAFRSDGEESDAPFDRVVKDLQRERVAQVLELGRLSPADSRALASTLLGAPADPAVFETIYSLDEGNPFCTEEAVRALRGRGQLYQDRGAWHMHADPPRVWAREYLRRPAADWSD